MQASFCTREDRTRFGGLVADGDDGVERLAEVPVECLALLSRDVDIQLAPSPGSPADGRGSPRSRPRTPRNGRRPGCAAAPRPSGCGRSCGCTGTAPVACSQRYVLSSILGMPSSVRARARITFTYVGRARGDGVVPLAVEGVRRELQAGHLLVGHLDLGRILAQVPARPGPAGRSGSWSRRSARR